MRAFKTKLKGFVQGVAMVPISLAAAHAIMGVVSDNYYDFKMPEDRDYSLKYRFETAFSFNTPDEHKVYMFWTRAGRADRPEGFCTNYLMGPYATYPAMVLAGLLGAKYAARKEEYGLYPTDSKTR